MTRPILAALLALLCTPAMAGEFADRIFAPGAFQAPEETRFHHERQGPEVEGFQPVEDGRLVVTPTDDRLVLTREVAGRTLPLSQFPADGGNPVLLFHLENITRSMATLTGGSPFYIRNRIREALVAAETGEEEERMVEGVTMNVRETVIQPFADDPNSARMGEFAGLTLRLGLAEDHPAQLVELSADTIASGGAYHEALTLIPEEEAR